MLIPSDLCSVLAGMQSVWIAEPAEQGALDCLRDGQIVSATVGSHRRAQYFSLNIDYPGISPVLPCRLHCSTTLYVSSVHGIVNIQFLLLFYLNSVLKQLLILVSYAKIVWIPLSVFLRHDLFPFCFFSDSVDLHYKFELTIFRENSLNILSAFYGFLCRNI